MSPRRRRPAGEFLLRSGSSVLAFWVGVVILAAVVLTPVVRGDIAVLAFVLPPSLLLVWVLWMVLVRPSIRYDAAGAVVTNFGRRHVLPWARVADVRQGPGMVFTLESGRRVIAYGTPPSRGPGLIAGTLDRRNRPRREFDHDAQLLQGARAAAGPTGDQVVSSWEVVPLAIGAVLVVAVLLEFAFGF